MKSLTPKNARWYSVFGLPVLMCVEYISALKVATSYKFLFIAFLSIKYSALVCFLFVTLLLFLFIVVAQMMRTFLAKNGLMNNALVAADL
ncbi:hypothetical protein PUR47_01705, partial [Klebsiella pneumoniae]|nr:hypothetical protein [Klebsiella pneumoniae]